MAHYGTAAAVKSRTGVKPDDLGMVDDAALDTFLDDLLTEASDLVNRVTRHDFTVDLAGVPAGIDGIANDVVADSVRVMVSTRQTPVVRVDDFAVKTVSARVLSPDIVKRLRLYSSRGLSSIAVTPGDLNGLSLGSVTAASLDTMDATTP